MFVTVIMVLFDNLEFNTAMDAGLKTGPVAISTESGPADHCREGEASERSGLCFFSIQGHCHGCQAEQAE